MKNEIKTLYNSIPTNLHIRYLDSLIGRVFKILPLKEEGSETVDVYISNLLYELTGNKELIAYLNNDSRYEAILSNLQKLISLKENYRAVVFNTIGSLTKDNYKEKISSIKEQRKKMYKDGKNIL